MRQVLCTWVIDWLGYRDAGGGDPGRVGESSRHSRRAGSAARGTLSHPRYDSEPDQEDGRKSGLTAFAQGKQFFLTPFLRLDSYKYNVLWGGSG